MPLALAALAAFVAGLLVAGGSPEREAAERFATAWAAGDRDAMYAELSPAAQVSHPRRRFERRYERAEATATFTGLTVGEARGPLEQGGETLVAVPVSYETRSFGTIEGEVGIPVDGGAVAWDPRLVFPGLGEGERLDRRMEAPERAPILADDGSELASGPAESRTTQGAGSLVAGSLGDPSAARAREMERQGFPGGTPAGTAGLELAFDGLLAGTPGGELVATGGGQRRVLAAADPVPGRPLRTTIDPDLQQAAADALGGLFGGVAVLDARNGEVRALAGIAFSAPQPPGSTMKIITAAGALEEGLTSPKRKYPVLTEAVVGGRAIENSESGACGGTLVQSFAKSCNTVFAPLGAELGGEKLVEIAERFGFNAPPTLFNEKARSAVQPPASTIPEDLGDDDLVVGISAIGQGEVLATPLQLASVAQTIANDGVRSPTPIVKGPKLRSTSEETEAVTPEVAEQVAAMMAEVVRSGTGQAAALPGTGVAGKTGTAELGPRADSEESPDGEIVMELDAWFAAFAPIRRPRLAIAVMIVNSEGDGGDIAAPIAARVLDAGL